MAAENDVLHDSSISRFNDGPDRTWLRAPRQSLGDYLERFKETLLECTDDGLRGCTVTNVIFSMPIEIAAMSETNAVNLSVSMPSQHMETSFMPVLHRVIFTLRREDYGVQ